MVDLLPSAREFPLSQRRGTSPAPAAAHDGSDRPPRGWPPAPPPSVLEVCSAAATSRGLSLVRFLVDPVFYFYMFWIPKYLAQERGLSLAEIGRLTWIPFLALGVSNILGGWVSDRLISAGIPASKARKLVMAAAAGLTVSSSLAAYPGMPGRPWPSCRC